MATLFISEYEDLGQTMLNCIREPPITTQSLTITNSVVTSAAFNKATRIVRMFADTTCFVAFSVTATATVTSPKINSLTEYFRAVAPNTSTQIAVLST